MNNTKPSAVHVVTAALQSRHKRAMEAINNHGMITNGTDVSELITMTHAFYDNLDDAVAKLAPSPSLIISFNELTRYFKLTPNHSITQAYNRYIAYLMLTQAKNILTREELDIAMLKLGYATIGDQYVKIEGAK